MNQKTPVIHKDIVFFLEALSKYCIFYFGEKEGLALYNYYCNNYVYIIPAIKNGKHVYGEKFSKLQLIFTKIKADIFFNKIDIYHVKWPYDSGAIKQIDFELFELTCFSFYEALGESEHNAEERLKLGFSSKVLSLLLPPKKELLFNHEEGSNKDTILLEGLYAELKKRNPDIIKEYGKSFNELSRDELVDYIDKRIKKTPQHISYALWLIIRKN